MKHTYFLFFYLCLSAITGCKPTSPTSWRVSSFNIWHNTRGGRLPVSATIEVIRKSGSDIIGFQECAPVQEGGERFDHIVEIADSLGFYLFRQQHTCAILSRYPIVDSTENRVAAKIALPDGKSCWMSNRHLYYIPYQPYQLNNIPYGDYPFLSTEVEAITSAWNTRGKEVEETLAELAPCMQEGIPVFVTGDFNEPSSLDWTTRAAQAGRCKLKVEWPATQAFLEAGFSDSYRTVYPNEVSHPGYTWTPFPAERDVPDRIDFVLFTGCKAEASFITGESELYADSVVAPFPSDHRMVTTIFSL